MAKKTQHKWNYQELLFCIEYAVKNHKNRDWDIMCEEVAEHINKNMSEDNNPTTVSSIQSGYNHIEPYLNGSTKGFGPGSKEYQAAIDEVMEKHNLPKSRMIIIFGK